MPVNDFEKQVQQKMEELQLRPSPGVWTEVEAQIRRDRRRRRVIFWWLLPVLLGGGMLGYYLLNRDKGDTIITDQSNIPSQKENKLMPGKESSGLQETLPTENNTRNNTDKIKMAEPVNESATSENRRKQLFNQPESDLTATITKPGSSATRKKTIKQEEPDRSHPIPNNDTRVDPLNQPLPVSGSISNPDSFSKKESTEPAIPARQSSVSPQIQKDSVAQKDTLFATIDEVKKEIPAVLPDSVDSEPSNPIKLKKKSRWEYALAVKPGLSNVREGNIFEGGAHSRDVFASPNAGSGVNFAPFALVPPQQVPQETFSFGIEFIAQKKISKSFMLLAGLEYTDLRSKINVGKRIDSAGSLMSANNSGRDYYQAPGTTVNSYSNNYHLLGLRTGLSWSVINSKKLSLRWENSLSLQQLIATNGLHYDPVKAVYYRDFSPFRKTQLIGSTGFAIPLLSRQKLNVELLPAVSYGFTPLLKQSSNSPSHFINYSIGLRFLFPQR